MVSNRAVLEVGPGTSNAIEFTNFLSVYLSVTSFVNGIVVNGYWLLFKINININNVPCMSVCIYI